MSLTPSSRVSYITVHRNENLKVLGPNECAAVGATKIGREN
jgi:hypothetical protein